MTSSMDAPADVASAKAPHGPELHRARRVWVVGSCGSGKTTVARRIARVVGASSAHVDDYVWLPGWKLRDRREMLDLVERRLAGDEWVMEGNLRPRAKRLWAIADRADLIVWLDLPFRVTFWRLVRRSFRRAVFREPCCNGNFESIRRTFLSSNSILLYAFQTRRLRSTIYPDLLSHRPHVRLRSVAQVNGWLAALEIESSQSSLPPRERAERIPSVTPMSTTDEPRTLSLDEARAHIARKVFSDHLGGPEVGAVGLEPEYLVFRVDAAGNPTGRLPLEGDSSVLSALHRLMGEAGDLKLDTVGPPPVYSLPDSGRITFEPGGQVEHSTAVHPSAAVAMEDADRVALLLNGAFKQEQASLASAGLDIWTDRKGVGQQLRADRYHCMAAYFHSRSEHGELMMRHTGSFQVNLDLGTREMAEERWRLANLLTPVALASFACSPAEGWQSRRAWAWQGLDPTRTGFPACMLAGERSDPGYCYAELALNADVLLFRNTNSGKAAPGSSGFAFRTWIEHGHPEHGFPSLDDLDYHLSTLFPEVRLRGFLEIRSADAVPIHLRAAQVIFWIGLLYDPVARKACLELLEPRVTMMQADWIAAAEKGFADQGLQQRATAVWQLALEGAARLPEGYFRPQDLLCAKNFLEDYVRRSRTAADDLAERMAKDPGAALRWTLGE